MNTKKCVLKSFICVYLFIYFIHVEKNLVTRCNPKEDNDNCLYTTTTKSKTITTNKEF